MSTTDKMIRLMGINPAAFEKWKAQKAQQASSTAALSATREAEDVEKLRRYAKAMGLNWEDFVAWRAQQGLATGPGQARTRQALFPEPRRW